MDSFDEMWEREFCRPCGVVIAGSPGTGKSTIVNRLHKFHKDVEATCVCDVSAVALNSVGGRFYCKLFDLSGSPCFFRGRTSIYCHAVNQIKGALLVFDLADRASFEALEEWYLELSVVFPLQDPGFVKILVGNKLDKQTLATPMKDVEQWAAKYGFCVCLTSATQNQGVQEILPYLENSMNMIPATQERNSDAMIHTTSPEQILALYRIVTGSTDWERLGLPDGADGVSINKAYRRLAAQIHPDKCTINGSGEAFKLLTASKDALTSS